MSLRDLVEGECGAPNPIARLTSHFVQDRALKEEGLCHPFPHSTNDFSNADADQLVQQFLGETLGRSPQTFHMDSLLQEMREMEMTGPIQGPGVAVLAASDPGMCRDENSIWAEQYLESGKQFDEISHGDQIWTSGPSVPMSNEVFEFGFGPNWASEYLQSSENNLEAADAWLDETEKIAAGNDANELRETANSLLEQSAADDPKFTYSKFMKFMGKIGDGEISIANGGVVESSPGTSAWHEEFEKEQQGRSEEVPNKGNKELAAEKEELQRSLLEVMEDAKREFGKEQDQPWFFNNDGEDDFHFEPFGEYVFSENNPMKDAVDVLETGHKLRAAGDLPGAVLCYEAAVQQESENAEAWLFLGKTQQENEQDPFAIPALKKARALDPANLSCLMALAVSYTNESYQKQACDALKEWLHCNPKYSHLVVPSDASAPNHSPLGGVSSMLSRQNCEDVKKMYIAAARLNPSNTIDTDVQCGLGVLFNLSNELDKAVDCFQAALRSNPGDPGMWNRLGASLANGNRSEEAVEAYHNALQLSPGFIRARYNLGITCINLQAHREAAEHLLTALNQQAAGNRSLAAMSDTIWSTLRLVLAMLSRQDLYVALEARDLTKLNMEFEMTNIN